MWCRSLDLFQVEGADPTTWADEFAPHPLRDPVGSAKRTFGFVSLPDTERLVDEHNGRYAFMVGVAQRNLPKDAVEREARKRAQLRGVADLELAGAVKASIGEVEASMLPHAPITETRTPAVYCHREKMLYVFGANRAGVEALQAAVRHALGSFVIVPVRPRVNAGLAMLSWLRSTPPGCLQLGEAVVMRTDGEGGTTAFRKQPLSEVDQDYFKAGEVVQKMELRWRDELEFTLTERGELTSIGPAGCKMKPHLAFAHWPEMMNTLPEYTREVLGVLGAFTSGPTGHAPHEGEPPRSSPGAYVPLILPDAGDSPPRVRAYLEAIHASRPLAAIVVMRRPVDAYRAAYAWAQERGVSVQLMPMPSEDNAAIEIHPDTTEVLAWGDPDWVQLATTSAAASHGLEVRRVQPAG